MKMMKLTMVNKLSSFLLCSLVYTMVSESLDDGFGDMSEDEVSRCYYDIICRLGVESHDEAFKCYLHAPHEELIRVSEWYKEFDPPVIYRSEDMNERLWQLCETDKETQDRYFQFFVQRFVDLMSEYCSNPLKQSLCHAWSQVTDCTQDLVREYNAKQMCEQP
ncbi:hypothetical protein X975_16780, partial [Stegodyphus mimosarum]